MNTVTVGANNQSGVSPYVVAAPFAMILFGFYGTFLPFGLLGIAGLSVVRLFWALLLGSVANRLARREAWRTRLANAPLFASILAIGLMSGADVIYSFMMLAAVKEPSTTYATLSALMQPAVPFYIILNTALELFVMLLVVFFNWNVDPRRRNLSILGVGLYLAMRVWTYLVCAETRLAISTQPLSPTDMEWFTRTLASDYRAILELASEGFFILAAMLTVHQARNRERWRVG